MMKRLSLGIIISTLVLSLLCTASPAVASTFNGDSIIGCIDNRLALLDSLIFDTSVLPAVPNALAGNIEVSPDSTYAAAVDAVTAARVSTIKAQTGLQITGQTYYRADGAIGLDDDDESVSRYTGKIQAELRWYFLQSGLLKRHGRIEEQRLKGEIARLEHEKGRSEPTLYARRERLHQVSDSILASVMFHRVENLQLLEDAYHYLLENESISGDDLLRILDDRAEAERRLSTITAASVTQAPVLAGVTAAIVNIDTAAIVATINATDIDLKLLDLKAHLLDKQADNTTWWSDVRIAPFVRYSHYFRHAMPSSSNLDAGLSFTVPINAEASRQRSAIRAEKALLNCNHDDMMARITDNVSYTAMETERLNRAIVGEWERAASLKEYIKTRRNAYSKRAGEYNRLAALKEYNSYLRCLENIIELQYRRDCLLADLQSLLPARSILQFCTFTTL